MDVQKYLNQKGIHYTELKNQSGIQAKTNCPQCGDKNSFAINLVSGAFQCFRQNKCGIRGSFFDFQRLLGDEPFLKKEKIYAEPQIKPERINEGVYQWFEKRKISAETVKKFKIGLSPNGREIMFLYHKSGKLINVKYRSMNEKNFFKEKDCKSILWNQDNIYGEKLYITEGETDCLALAEYGIIGVSIPSGVNDLTWIEHDWKFLERFKQIILIMDNDTAGQSIIENLVNRLGKWRCKNVLLPYKDLNECLMMKVSKEKFDEFISKAEEFNIAELKHCDYYTDEIISYKNNPNKLYGTVTSSYKLTEILKGWRREELSVWTGQNGAGKSTYLSQEIIHLLRQGKKCCIGSFEMPPRKYLWWLVKQGLSKNDITDYDVNFILNGFAENLFIIDITGEIEKENLFEIIQFGCRKYGIEIFVIDSLMKIKLSADNNRLYGEQKNFVNRLADFVREYKCHIHLVAHPRKAKTDEYESDKTDVAGSGDITNIADNVFLVYRYSKEQIDKRKNQGKEPYDSFLEVKKNREHGELGKVGLYFNKDYKTFETEVGGKPLNNFYETGED
jgi:twinkle protein